MKRILLLAAIALGVGVATTRADVPFGVSIDSSRNRAYASGTYAPPPVYSQGAYSPAYAYPSPGAQHDALHRGVRDARHDFERDLRAQKKAINYGFDQQRAAGVPEWQVKPQREAANRQIKAIRRAGLQELKEAHNAGHDVLQPQHDASHHDLRW